MRRHGNCCPGVLNPFESYKLTNTASPVSQCTVPSAGPSSERSSLATDAI